MIASLPRETLPVPTVHASSDTHSAVVLGWMDGTTDFNAVSDEESKNEIARQLARILFDLHQLETDDLEISNSSSIGDAVMEEISIWSTMYYEGVSDPEPLVDYALQWLRNNIPDVGKPALIHGDIGLGNFLIDNNRISAVLDWELAHIGHPYEDLACLIARDIGAPFEVLPQCLDEYFQLTEESLDLSVLKYYLILVITRFVIGILRGVSSKAADTDVAILYKFKLANMAALMFLLADVHELHVGPLIVPPVELPARYSNLFDTIRSNIDLIVEPSITDRFAKHRLDGIRYMLDVLELASSNHTAALDVQELSEMENLLGTTPGSIDHGLADIQLLIRSGDHPTEIAVLNYLCGRIERLFQTCGAGMGDLGLRCSRPDWFLQNDFLQQYA